MTVVRGLLSSLMIIMLLLLAVPHANAADCKLNGGMIQFRNASVPWPWNGTLPIDWKKIVREMKALGMDTIVLQNMVHREDKSGTTPDYKDWTFYFLDAKGKPTQVDPLAQILEEADAQGMTVYFGLMYNEKINGKNGDLMTDTDADRARFAKRFSDDQAGQLAHADVIWKAYSSYPAFKGWYVPFEAWNFKWQNWKNDVVRDYLGAVTGALATKHRTGAKRLPVMLAPHFIASSPQHADPATTTAVFTKVMSSSKIEVLAVQDGFGVTVGRTKADIDAYFPAFKKACDATISDLNESGHVDLWSDAELLAPGPAPTTVDRLMTQLCSVKNYVQGIICWHFYHYMNNSVPDAPPNSEMIVTTQKARAEFQKKYKAKFVDAKCACP